jgi:S1-C subfamily serine protease
MALDPDQHGVRVMEVVPGSPADEAGLHGSYKMLDLLTILQGSEPGQELRLRLPHDDDGDEITVEVTLGER